MYESSNPSFVADKNIVFMSMSPRENGTSYRVSFSSGAEGIQDIYLEEILIERVGHEGRRYDIESVMQYGDVSLPFLTTEIQSVKWISQNRFVVGVSRNEKKYHFSFNESEQKVTIEER